MLELRRELGDRFERFQSLDSLRSPRLVYGRKGRLGYTAKTVTFTSLVLRMPLGIRGVSPEGMVS